MATVIVHDNDTAESANILATAPELSLSQVSKLMRDYIIVPKNRAKAFDSQAILSMKRQLADARQENTQLRKRLCEALAEIEKLKKSLPDG